MNRNYLRKPINTAARIYSQCSDLKGLQPGIKRGGNNPRWIQKSIYKGT